MDSVSFFDDETENFDPAANYSSCPSLGSSFLSIDTSPLALNYPGRRSITASSSCSPEIFSAGTSHGTASPTTPVSGEMIVGSQGTASMAFRPHYGLVTGSTFVTSGDALNEMLWSLPESRHWTTDAELVDAPAHAHLNGVFMPHEYNHLTASQTDPALSQSIFREANHKSNLMGDDSLLAGWTASVLATPAQTVAPSATVQEPFSTPSRCTLSGVTPSPIRYQQHSTPVHATSPFPVFSPSHHQLGSSLYFGEDLPLRNQRDLPARRPTQTPRRAYRRTDPAARRANKEAVRRSGNNCAEVIAKNEHFCTYADCLDKNGKRKAFKRAEHKKRHENTVHGHKNSPALPCWACERIFTRRDNLKSHMKTHTKRTAASRNMYVATLDPDNEYYDEKYRGPLDENGYPVRAV